MSMKQTGDDDRRVQHASLAPANHTTHSQTHTYTDAHDRDVSDFVDSISAAMPPSMQDKRVKTADELLEELNRVPLFMTSLDETDGEGGENVMLEAIKALQYEGTKSEVAENFRDQGNDAARAKLWSDAREFYTKAILTLQGKAQTQLPDPDSTPAVVEMDEEAEAKKERDLEQACYANRALCNLEMKNYGSCNRDCAAALRLNPRNVKAWYRAASACLALDKLPEALDACTSGLHFDPPNAALQSLRGRIETRQQHVAQLERDRQARLAREHRERTALRTALETRHIRVRDTDSPPDLEDARISLADVEDPTSTLSFPVVFLYPLDAQTDFVKAFQENETLSDHLAYMLPPPWDAGHEYASDTTECYMDTAQGGLIKAGKKLTLAKLLGSGKLEIVDGLVRVYVVPKARTNEWLQQVKERRGKQ